MKRLDLWKANDWRLDPFYKILIKLYDEQMNCDVYLTPEKIHEMAVKEELSETDFYKSFLRELERIRDVCKEQIKDGWTREVEFIKDTKYQFMREKFHNGGARSDWILYVPVGPSDYIKKNTTWVLDESAVKKAEERDVIDVILYDEYNSCCFYTTMNKIKSGTKDKGKLYVSLRHFETHQFNEDKYPKYM